MSNIKKFCPDCNLMLPLENFHKDKSKKYGLTTYCKQCSHIRDQIRYSKRKERSNQTNREYYQNNKDRLIKKNKRYQQNNKDAVNAKNQLEYAVRVGKIIRPENCQVCLRRTDDIHGHHEDYSKPLEVKWLCRSCHRITHLKEDSRT